MPIAIPSRLAIVLGFFFLLWDKPLPVAAGEINNAEAMRAASTPSTVCSIRERARCSIYRRTRADEKEFQPLVEEMFLRCRDGLRFLGDLRENPRNLADVACNWRRQ